MPSIVVHETDLHLCKPFGDSTNFVTGCDELQRPAEGPNCWWSMLHGNMYYLYNFSEPDIDVRGQRFCSVLRDILNGQALRELLDCRGFHKTHLSPFSSALPLSAQIEEDP